MNLQRLGQLCCVLPLLVLTSPVAGEEPEQLKPLFNGRDLAGWVNVNCAPGTFSVKDGIIVSTGVPTGVMRTERHYENFILELEWKHMKAGGNAGLFVWSDPLTAPGVPFTRSIEVQILDGRTSENYTSHGDIFSIHGARFTPDRPHPGGWERSLPTEHRAKPAGEWNHYRVECRDGRIALAVNGKVVSGGHSSRPRKGYICLEAEGSECHFRNLRILELPSSGAKSEETAAEDQGFRTIYTGVDLAGFRADKGHTGHWKPNDWRLTYDGKSEAPDKHLWTEKEYGDFTLVCDWRLSAKPKKRTLPVILPTGDDALDDAGKPKQVEVDDAGQSGIILRGSEKCQVSISCSPVGSGEVRAYRTDKNASAGVRAAVTPKKRADKPPGEWNRFVITMQKDRLTVELNGQKVIGGAQVPGVAARGPIGLAHHGDAVEFANLYVKETP